MYDCAIGFATATLEITNKSEECSICLQIKDIFIKINNVYMNFVFHVLEDYMYRIITMARN